MKKIEVFDEEYERLKALAEKYGLWIEDVIEGILDDFDEDDEKRVFES